MPFRKNIIELLELYASEEEQLAYEMNVPYADITAELTCMWFDDLYHPNSRLFTNSFNEKELAILEDFHKLFDSKFDDLPESGGPVKTWLKSPAWRDIMIKAKQTLAALGY